MASQDSLLAFFTRMNDINGIVVTEHPKLDLDLYVQNYSGRTRFDRLLLIGKSCVPLCVDALKAAVAEAKASSDVSRYVEAWDHIRLAAPHEPEAQKDDAWIEKTERANKAETARLETELKGYRHNLIKESIRMGNEDLGKHFESIGHLNEANEAYSRMRQDVSTPKHIMDCGIHLVSVSLQRRDWSMVLSNLGKVIGVQSNDDDSIAKAYTKIVSGIALLGLGHYQDAAKSFLKTSYAVPSSEYKHVASSNDVAIYGGLLALATMERKDLQTQVLDNQSFRSFLEQDPLLRKAISFFVNGKYSNCLSILESMKNDLLLDIYLQSHVAKLFGHIRTKCIVQYTVPFSYCSLQNLENAFGQQGKSIEEELVAMIADDKLKARIDAKNKLLIAIQPDARQQMQKNALDVAHKYEQEAKERLRRMNIIAAGLEVVGLRKPAGSRQVDETWYEDPVGNYGIQA